MEGLSKSVAKEVGDGMTIVTLDPGVVNTEMLFTLLGNTSSQFQTPQKWYHYNLNYFTCFSIHLLLC